MCNYLLESLCTTFTKASDISDGRLDSIYVPSYDTKGLFLASTTQLLNEQCCQTKDKLEQLLKTIIYISRIKAKQGGKNCELFDLICEWCNGETVMCRSIGFKLMTLYLPLELSDNKLKGLSQPILDIFNKAVQYLVELEDENSSPILAYLIANILQLFKLLLEVSGQSSNPNVYTAAKEFVFGTIVKSGKANNFLVHENVSVRNKTLEFIEKVFQLKLELLMNGNSSELYTSKTKKKRKTKIVDDKFHISVENLKNVLNNLCELAKVDVREEELLIRNLTLMYEICEIDPSLSKCVSEGSETSENEYLTGAFVYKKARSIFIHEKFHINGETSRRLLFYKLVLNILQRINEQKQERDTKGNAFSALTSLPIELQQLIEKHLNKDRKQPYLEELSVQIEKEIQDLIIAK